MNELGKKTGLLTVNRLNNFGTDLQLFAMFHLFSSIFDNFEVINYVSPKLENSRKIFKKPNIKNVLRLPYLIYKTFVHAKLRKKYLNISQKKYYSVKDIEKDYSTVVVGSDQIWNLNITEDINFYLPESKTITKFSYAVSFGKTNLNEFEKKYCITKLLKQFECISIRERSGVEALNKISNLNVREDLDPILMVESKFLLSFFKRKKHQKPYILLYLVDSTKEIIDFARELSKEYNAKIFMVSEPRYLIKGVCIKSFVSLGKWLSYINNAACVITNSYHGVSTSIALNKETYIVDLNNKEANSRTESLLNKIGASKIIRNEDYTRINSRINELRKRSLKFINTEIGKNEN